MGCLCRRCSVAPIESIAAEVAFQRKDEQMVHPYRFAGRVGPFPPTLGTSTTRYAVRLVRYADLVLLLFEAHITVNVNVASIFEEFVRDESLEQISEPTGRRA